MKKLIFLLLLALPFFGFSQAAYLMEFTNPNGSKVVFNLNDVRSCVAEGTGSYLFTRTGSGKTQVQESPATIALNSCGNIVLFTVYLPASQYNTTKQMGVNPNYVVGVVSNTSGNGVLKMISPTENFTTTGDYNAAVSALSNCVSGGGGGGGSLTNTYVGFGDGLNQLDGEAGFTYDAESNRLAVDTVKTKRISSKAGSLEILNDIKFNAYPNTRDDSGLPVNIFSTDASGNLRSDPLSALPNLSLKGVDIALFGDSFSSSLSDPARWPLPFITETQSNLVSYAVSGNTIAQQSTILDALLTSDPNALDTIAYVVILVGANDYAANTAIGTVSSVVNGATYAGKLRHMIETIYSANTAIQVFVVTPPEGFGNGVNYKTANAAGWTIKDLSSVISDVCNYYSIKVVNFWAASNWNDETKSYYTSDLLHPSVAGANILAKYIARHIWDGITSSQVLNSQSFSAGAVPFGNGTGLTSDLAGINYDDTNNRLGLGTVTPNRQIELAGTNPYLRLNSSSSSDEGIEFYSGSSKEGHIRMIGSTGNLNLSSGRNAAWGGNITFTTDTLVRLTLTSLGRLGLNVPTGSISSKFMVRGDGVTSATNPVLIQNSAAAECFKVGDDGAVYLSGPALAGRVDVSGQNPVLNILGALSSGSNYLNFKSAGVTDAYFEQQPATGAFRISAGRGAGWGGKAYFRIDGTDRGAWNATGLSVGLTSNPSKFAVDGDVRFINLSAKTGSHTELVYRDPSTGELAHEVASPITTLAAVGSTPNANAATITGSTLNLEPASASFPGVVTTTTQNFAGTKRITATNPLQLNGLQSGAKTDSIVVVNGGILKTIPSTSLKFPLKMTVVDGNTDVPGAGLQTYEVIRIPAC